MSPRIGIIAGTVTALLAAGWLVPAAAQQRSAADVTQCYTGTDQASVISGCNVMLSATAGYSADEVGLALQRRAEALAGLGRYDEAVRDFRDMISRGYNPHRAHALIGGVRYSQGRYAEAEQSYREALRLNASYALARTGLGQTLIALGRPRDAEAELKQALATAPSDANVHFGLGVARYEAGDLDGAIRAFDAALALKPDHVDALFQRAQAHQDNGNAEAALRDADSAVDKANGSKLMLALVYRGRFRNNAKRYSDAIADCSEAARLAERYAVSDGKLRASAFVCLGLARANRGELKEAKADYDRAMQWDREDPAAFTGRGYVSYQRGHFDLAARDFEQALSLQPKSQDALRYLGLTYADNDNLAKALQVFERAVEADPKDPWPFMLRAMSLARTGERARALKDAEAAFGLAGVRNSDAFLARATVHYLLDELDAARRDLDAAIAADPANGQAHMGLARLLLRQNRLGEAATSLAKAARTIRFDPVLTLNRGLLALAQKDYPAAVREITRSLDVNSSYAEGFAARGQAHEALGRRELAIADYRTAATKLALDNDGRRAKALASRRLAALLAPQPKEPPAPVLATGAKPPAVPAGAGPDATPKRSGDTVASVPPDRPSDSGASGPAGSPSAGTDQRVPAGEDRTHTPDTQSETVFCRVFEGLFSHTRRYTGVEVEVGCRPAPDTLTSGKKQ